MRLRDWLVGWLIGSDDSADTAATGNGETDDETERSVLDEENYSDRELREDKVRLQDQRRQVERDLDEFRSGYQELMEDGSKDDITEERRRELAHRARMVKKKYKAAKQKYADIRSELALVVSIEAAREVMDLVDRGNRTHISQMIDDGDLSTEQVAQVMEEKRVEYGLRQEEMADARAAMDVDMMPGESTLEESEEYKRMQKNAEDGVDDHLDTDIEGEHDHSEPLDAGLA